MCEHFFQNLVGNIGISHAQVFQGMTRDLGICEIDTESQIQGGEIVVLDDGAVQFSAIEELEHREIRTVEDHEAQAVVFDAGVAHIECAQTST